MDTTIIDKCIQGRVEPSIYAFLTNKIPNALKVGDTYRPVAVRLQEWEKYFPELQQQFEATAKVDEQTYFRDYSVHKYLEETLKKHRLQKNELLSEDIFYSKEFFHSTTGEDVKEAIKDIKKDFDEKKGTYEFYNALTTTPVHVQYASQGYWEPRPNQKAAIEAFEKARQKKRHNLLMYAVMRFGKSFTALCCAQKMDARLVVVVSAKADVEEEWRKTVESAENFRTDYDFLTSKEIKLNYNLVNDKLKKERKKVVLFLTLQDLQGKEIKQKHKQIFSNHIDLLIVDETHFGARAKSYGQVLKNTQFAEEKRHKYDDDDYTELESAQEQLKSFKAKIVLHLSGTPYRILMGSEFQPEDIVAFCQFADIIHEKEEWDKNHLAKDEEQEWDNPYFGFPQMIRFAFNPNESSRKRMEELNKSGLTYALSALLKPESVQKKDDGNHKKFLYEKEVLDLLKVIDGSATDKNLLSFLDYPKIKEGKMCRHMVFVLPYCASCDAMEALLINHAAEFKNLRDYKILNISGIEQPASYKTPKAIQDAIREFEKNGQKTITLTVNRMLTGSTVPEWDTMLFLKDTASPQEYDQAIFRLQNQYVVSYVSQDGKKIKLDMKPQTLLVDFDPMRMFRMQETKAQIYNVNVDDAGNSKLQERITEDLRISPIIALNAEGNRMVKVQPVDIMNAVSEYSSNRGVMEETWEIPVDGALQNNPTVWNVLKGENELGSKNGFDVKPNQGEEKDMHTPGNTGNQPPSNTDDSTSSNENDEEEHVSIESVEKRFRMYYTRILYYAYLTQDTVISLQELLQSLNKSRGNRRIFRNLKLDQAVLKEFLKMDKFVLQELDYAIQHLNQLSKDKNKTPLERAEVADKKFGKLGQSQIVTPAFIADQMVAMFPDNFLRECVQKRWAILDIASKKGEFATALCRKFNSLGFKSDQYRDLIYSIPTSSICYEFTRKVYEILNLNHHMIAENFNSYDLLKVKNESGHIDSNKIRELLSQNKKFDTITMHDESIAASERRNIRMKFKAVVGNPPYQGTNHRQIYPFFYLLSRELSRKYVSLIFPAGWQEPKDANNLSKLNNEAIKRDKQIHFIDNRENIFQNVSGAQYTNIILWEKGYDNGLNGYQNIRTNGQDSHNVLLLIEKELDEKPSEIVKLADIVIHSNGFRSLQYDTSVLKPYGLRTDVFRNPAKYGLPSFNRSKINNNDLTIYGMQNRREKIMYAPVEYPLPKRTIAFDQYKVFVPYAWGNMDERAGIGGAFSDIIVAEPYDIATETYLESGHFSTKELAYKHAKYLMTKFLRACLFMNKHSQHSTTAWGAVPVQDYSEDWWDKDIATIDEYLFKKYDIPYEIKEFILNSFQTKTEENIIDAKA